jgi:hypothetical protein
MARKGGNRQYAPVKTNITFSKGLGEARKRSAHSAKPGGKAGGGFFVHLLGFSCCLAMPAFWTAIAPVSFTTFTREEGKVRAVARQNLFFVIPYRTSVVEDVKEVDDRFRQGEIVRSRVDGERRTHRSESESFLVIRGTGELVEVPVSPVNARSTVKKAEDFLRDPKQANIRLITVANWKFSVIGGVFVTLLAMLYVTGVILSVFRFFGRLMKPSGVVETPSLPIPPPSAR